jgi:restriction system protein
VEDINTWEKSKIIEDLLPSLSFIENIEYWYSYFQGGVRQITEDDYRIILSERETSLVGRLNIAQDIESQTEFALETHLEEFIYSNWVNIDWGANLLLYKTEEQDGRQFPAGTWSIDFLATDKNTKDLVVIELKRGKTSDATVGQILRYISWVKENVAEKGQNVRGIIIAKDIDDALRYAVKSLDNIEVKKYKVDFQLQ